MSSALKNFKNQVDLLSKSVKGSIPSGPDFVSTLSLEPTPIVPTVPSVPVSLSTSVPNVPNVQNVPNIPNGSQETIKSKWPWVLAIILFVAIVASVSYFYYSTYRNSKPLKQLFGPKDCSRKKHSKMYEDQSIQDDEDESDHEDDIRSTNETKETKETVEKEDDGDNDDKDDNNDNDDDDAAATLMRLNKRKTFGISKSKKERLQKVISKETIQAAALTASKKLIKPVTEQQSVSATGFKSKPSSSDPNFTLLD